MALQLGKSAMMRLPEPLLHRSVGNPGVVQAMLVAPDTLYIAGIDVGSTNMIIQGKSGACSVVDIVGDDGPGRVPGQPGRGAAGRKGHPRDGRRRFAGADRHGGRRRRRGARRRTGRRLRAPAGAAAQAVGKTDPARAGRRRRRAPAAAPAGGVRVVNMLSVSAPQQVMLEVKIAEVSKTLLERLEAGAT